MWRRVRHDESLSVLDGNIPSGGSPQWAKELWIYWYGEDPKFDELITYPELKGKRADQSLHHITITVEQVGEREGGK